MEYFDRLGAGLQRAWSEADRDEERFPDLAASALEADPPAAGFETDSFFDAMLDPSLGGRQHLAPVGAFGQPGFTVFHGEGFVIEVYVWSDSLSAIHNHPFCGVFTVLEGFSVQARYRTSVASRAGGRGQLLDVHLAGLDLVRPTEVHRFSLRRHPLVHALIHVPVPSISMVVRTTRTEGYFRYLPPSIAVPMEPPSEPTARRLALLESLLDAQHPSALDRVCTAMGQADFETMVRLMSSAWPRLDPSHHARLWDACGALHGDRRDAVERALRRARRLEEASAIRSGLRDPDHRLVATALAYAEQRSHVFDLLAQHGEPLSLLHDFIANAGLFAAGEEASAHIATALAEGHDTPEVLRRLGERYGESPIAAQEAEIRRYVETSIFSPLR